MDFIVQIYEWLLIGIDYVLYFGFLGLLWM